MRLRVSFQLPPTLIRDLKSLFTRRGRTISDYEQLIDLIDKASKDLPKKERDRLGVTKIQLVEHAVSEIVELARVRFGG